MAENDAPELNPCPFCGGPAEFIDPGFKQSRVRCENPGNLPWCIGAEVSATPEQWNTRADLAAPDAAQKVAQEIVPACLSRTCFIKDCGRDRCWGCDDSVLERKRVAEIISRHFAIDADAVRRTRRETWNSAASIVDERGQCICPFSTDEFPHNESCPKGIAAALRLKAAENQ